MKITFTSQFYRTVNPSYSLPNEVYTPMYQCWRYKSSIESFLKNPSSDYITSGYITSGYLLKLLEKSPDAEVSNEK